MDSITRSARNATLVPEPLGPMLNTFRRSVAFATMNFIAAINSVT